MTPELPDKVLDQLVALARSQRSEPPWRERQFLDRLDEHLAERVAKKARGRRRAATGLVLAACAAAVALVFNLLAPSELSYEVAGGAVRAGYIESRGDTKVQFSDGSELALAEGARARVNDVTAHGSRVELERGTVSVNVVKAEHNAWFVDAGPYTVHVIGTAFEVRWSKEDQRFELDLHRGSVVITGPSIRGSVKLSAGQKLIGLPNSPATVRSAVAANTVPAPPVPAAESEVALGPQLSLGEPAPREPGGAVGPSWGRLVAQGKFREVISAAQARGLRDVLASASLADLSALADAARYARNQDVARQALLSERKRFPGSKAARDAAFFLGGLEENRAQVSMEWYDRYLAESPQGPYTSQALGRRLMLLYRERGAAAATPRAKEYLTRFPKGPYASLARKIVDRQP